MWARPFGEHAVLIEFDDPARVPAAYAALRAVRHRLGYVDLVPAELTVLVAGIGDPSALLPEIDAVVADAGDATDVTEREEVVLPVTYDGPDLADVARQWDVTTEEVRRLHRETSYVVAFCGFAPGFAYCTGLPEELAVPRRSEPRPAVPPGSVGLAGRYTGVYPRPSPGGWQLIGRTRTRLWRPEAASPALLVPGTSVRFTDE